MVFNDRWVVRLWIKSNKRARRLKVAYSARGDGICRILGIARSQGTCKRGRSERTMHKKEVYFDAFGGAGYATLEITRQDVGCGQ